MPDTPGIAVVALVLGAAAQLNDAVHAGVRERGFADVRPAHGFAFARISAGDATTADVAEHLGVSKQAASQLIEQLVQRGYVDRVADRRDGRARVLRLTERGWACTRAAEDAADDAIGQWRAQLTPTAFEAVRAGLATVVRPGQWLRPAW